MSASSRGPNPSFSTRICGACLVGVAGLAGPTFVSRAIEEVAPQLGLLVTVVHAEPFVVAVHTARVLLATLGLWLFVRRPRWVHRWRRVGIPGCVGLLLGTSAAALWVHDIVELPSQARAEARQMADIEQVILHLTPELRPLEVAVQNLKFPSLAATEQFADSVVVVGVGQPSAPESVQLLAVGVETRQWSLDSAIEVLASDLQPWQAYLHTVVYVESAAFAIEDGTLDPTGTRFEGRVRFAGLARVTSSPDRLRWSHLRAHQLVVWQRSSPEAADWVITRWEQQSFETTEADTRLFRESLDDVLVGAEQRDRARRSIHEEHVLRAIREPGSADPHSLFQIPSADRHPGVAVVDIDGDGDDDLYVMARWGENLLLRNRGDGTFDEAAASFGLAIHDHSSSAIFADFDNDGDPDLFLGRTLEPSLYLLNEGGHFIDHTVDLLEGLPPHLVSSLSAADFDNDGLLDLYVATFAPDVTASDSLPALLRGSLLPDFLSKPHAEAYHARFFGGSMHPILNNIGPPNILLKNMGGGRLAPLTHEGPELLYRHTYQASWSDIDNDGDQDLYCANDVAKNTLLLNRGDGTFEDVTEPTGTGDIGFGMGVSFGDYNDDGLQDLYVTNMFSKAGRRITARLGGLDSQFADMSRGNSLFRNEGDRFVKVSGLEPPGLLVEEGGWGWGGQFVDLDNDGRLDLYALSGYFTAPAEVALPVDT